MGHDFPGHAGRIDWPWYLRREPWAAEFSAETWRERLRYGTDAAALARLRQATQRRWVFGEEEFIAELEQRSERRLRPFVRSRPTVGGATIKVVGIA